MSYIQRRLCRPEIYRVKYTIYSSLKRYSELLSASLTSSTQSTNRKQEHIVSTLVALVYLFNIILQQESYTVSLSTTSPNSGHFRCDFCGADIFSRCFECRICVDVELSPASVHRGDGFILCNGCYIDGRTCKCGSMDPLERLPMNNLLRDRDTASMLLAQSGTSLEGHSQHESEPNTGCVISGQTSSNAHVGREWAPNSRTFLAAITLHEIRKKVCLDLPPSSQL